MSIFSTILNFGGGALLLIALLSLGGCNLSLIERLQHGPGLLFADVEIFGFLALICALAGGAAFFAARKLARRKREDLS